MATYFPVATFHGLAIKKHLNTEDQHVALPTLPSIFNYRFPGTHVINDMIA